MPAVVILESNKLISVKDEWIREKIKNKYTIIFHSPNNDDEPQFQLKSEYYFRSKITACYKARTIRFFDSIDLCEQFIKLRPRRIYYDKLNIFQQPEIVDAIDLSCCDEEITDKNDLGIAENESANISNVNSFPSSLNGIEQHATASNTDMTLDGRFGERSKFNQNEAVNIGCYCDDKITNKNDLRIAESKSVNNSKVDSFPSSLTGSEKHPTASNIDTSLDEMVGGRSEFIRDKVTNIGLSCCNDNITDKQDLGIAENESTNISHVNNFPSSSKDIEKHPIASNVDTTLHETLDEGSDFDRNEAASISNERFDVINDNDLPEKKKDLFYVMLIANNNSLIAVKKEWVEHPTSEESRFFYSPEEDLPVFTEPLHYFKDHENGCYFGRRIKCFDSYEKAKKYAERPRRLQQADIANRIVEKHVIVDDDDQTKNASSSIEQFEGDIKLKIKQERIDLLENALKKLTQRVGIEIIEDDDNNNPPARSRNFDSKNIVNTHAYLLDSEFGKNFFYLNNSKGDRYYFHETLKIEAGTIQKLKSMNESYPQNNVDYDIEFIYHLAVATFNDVETEGYLKEKTLKCFNVVRLRFVRTIYEERVGEDKVRKKAFREHLFKALSDRLHG